MAEPTEFEWYFLSLVNGTRADVGALPLTFDDDLMESAAGHNEWMDANDTRSHTGANDSSDADRIRAAGYDGIYMGENLWHGVGTDPETGEIAGESRVWVEEAHNEFFWSRKWPDGHYWIMIDPKFQHVGISFIEGDYEGQPAAYATPNFGGNGPAEPDDPDLPFGLNRDSPVTPVDRDGLPPRPVEVEPLKPVRRDHHTEPRPEVPDIIPPPILRDHHTEPRPEVPCISGPCEG